MIAQINLRLQDAYTPEEEDLSTQFMAAAMSGDQVELDRLREDPVIVRLFERGSLQMTW